MLLGCAEAGSANAKNANSKKVLMELKGLLIKRMCCKENEAYVRIVRRKTKHTTPPIAKTKAPVRSHRSASRDTLIACGNRCPIYSQPHEKATAHSGSHRSRDTC